MIKRMSLTTPISLLVASRKIYPIAITVIPNRPEKISNIPITMTAVNPEAPGSPTGPRLVVKAQKAEVAERMGKQIQTDPSPALKYEPSFTTLETNGEIGAQRVVTNGHHASKAFKNAY